MTDTQFDYSNLESLSDEVVIQLVSEGNNEAFGVIYQRYITAIYNYIYYRNGNPHDAEDLTARVFHRAYGHISSYKIWDCQFLLGYIELLIILCKLSS
jgi:RNA polymerase sigma-70 factor (ECF subfamily)